MTREQHKTYRTEPGFETPDPMRRRASHAFEVTLPASTEIPVAGCPLGMSATGVVAPASAYASTASFGPEFIGVSAQAHASSTAAQVITVYAEAEIEFDCDAATYEALEMVMLDDLGAALSNTHVVKATTGLEADAIGCVTSPAPGYANWEHADGATKVLVTVRAPRALDGFIQ